MNIGCPFPRFSSVVQIEHRCHRINTQSVNVEFFDPEHCTGNQEALHFRTSKIKNSGSPMRVFPFLNILIFITLGTVKLIQSLFVLWKMCWDPVHNNTDIVFMHLVDKVHEVLWGTITGSGCKISGYLITPGWVKRVFGNWHQFHVSISHVLDIRCQFIRTFAVIKKLSILILTPRTKVHFINIDWFTHMILQFSFIHPRLIFPEIFSKLIKAGC